MVWISCWYGMDLLQHSLHFFPKEGQVNPHHPRCSAGKGVWWPHLWDLLAVSLNDISAHYLGSQLDKRSFTWSEDPGPLYGNLPSWTPSWGHSVSLPEDLALAKLAILLSLRLCPWHPGFVFAGRSALAPGRAFLGWAFSFPCSLVCTPSSTSPSQGPLQHTKTIRS